ncbi:hypothetical protein D3C85_1439450 [compost metagenome]
MFGLRSSAVGKCLFDLSVASTLVYSVTSTRSESIQMYISYTLSILCINAFFEEAKSLLSVICHAKMFCKALILKCLLFNMNVRTSGKLPGD